MLRVAATSALQLVPPRAGGRVLLQQLAAAMATTTTAAAPNCTMFKIYTKTGDKGESSLYNGKRLPKDDQIFHALGDVDELNSAVGVAKEFCRGQHEQVADELEEIQSRLLDVGSAVATPLRDSSPSQLERAKFDAAHTAVLEERIDRLHEQLPPLRNFILPSGGKAAAFLHTARSICRRSERTLVPLVREELLDPSVATYMNRLSDYLFTAARFACMTEKAAEVVYKKTQ